MVVVIPAAEELDTDILSLYFAKDPTLGNLPVVIFHGPSMTSNSTLNSSRIQAHIYSIAGYQSFPRLTISPTSPLYAAVEHLPEEKQGDEICRGLAASLLKYYAEIPKAVKASLKKIAAAGRPDGKAPAMFDEMHAGTLAGKMARAGNCEEVASHITTALCDQSLSWTDIDVILPPRSIYKIEPSDDPEIRSLYPDDGRPWIDYGKYEQLVNLFGSPTFLPTSNLKRAPSRPTAMSRTRTLAKGQKESIRRQMQELLETEERYVMKLYDLAKSVAVEFCRNTDNKPYQSTTPSQRAMQKLFPDSLNQILTINTEFLDSIRSVVEQSEEGAVQDFDGDANKEHNGHGRPRPRDLTGADLLAKVLLEYFPLFREPYQAYLRASTEFPSILNEVLRDSASNFSQALIATGEQRLRSWLIEPVQRLPRYSLFIDALVQELPATHPAMNKFLKAKDTITDICALDNGQPADKLLTTTRLRDLVASWPQGLSPSGRLITAVDVGELKAPYKVHPNATEGQPTILLLFPDTLVVVRKLNAGSLSARGVIAQLDLPATAAIPSLDLNTGLSPEKGLSFAYAFGLHETRFTESNGGRLIQMACVQRKEAVQGSHASGFYTVTRAFRLLGSYEGKAARWNEEVGRARIEQRFPEEMRESDKWGLRSTSPVRESLGVLAAVFENDSEAFAGRHRIALGRIQVIIDPANHFERPDSDSRWRDSAVEITIRVTLIEKGKYQLDCMGYQDFSSTDLVTDRDFAPVFIKRLSNLQRIHNQPETDELARAHISFHQKIIETAKAQAPSEEPQSRRFRPISPVKALSSFLGGSTKEQNSAVKQLITGLYSKDAPALPPPERTLSKTKSHQNISLASSGSHVTLVGVAGSGPKDSLAQLEASFNAYVVALRSRSGNVVGKILRARGNADELSVNELYNILVEDPTQIQAAAEVPIDILFAAFEKFLDKAWRERMGPVLPGSILRSMQSALDASKSAQAAERFKSLLNEMSPQNRRAFTAMIKLLSDLLDASGSDGDRGALIVAFAEALVVEGNAHSYVNLLDRLADDYEVLFEDSHVPPSPQRARSTNTGSLSSNASSLKKRFGLGSLSRENSKSESESRVGHVWRSLGKKAAGEGEILPTSPSKSQPSSISKSFLSRSRSTENDSRKPMLSRPSSQDGSTTQDERGSRPGSAHNALSNLATIGEGAAQSFAPSPKKKRRSSLSDLLTVNPSSPFADPFKSYAPENSIEPFQTARQAPRTPSPIKQQTYTIASVDVSKRFGSPNRGENSAPSSPLTLKERPVNRKSDEVIISSFSPKKRDESRGRIPSSRGGLQERPGLSTAANLSPKKAASPQKLRIQSPQKLRERLQNEQKVIRDVAPTVQAELSKIGQELSAMNASRAHGRKVSSTGTGILANRIGALEAKIAALSAEMERRTTSAEKDVESSLTVSEKKCKSLDELYREANAENEALYERFNEELGRVLRSVKAGHGGEEMKAKMQAAQDEAVRLRRENQRLKRENAGLRSQLRD